MHSTTRSIRSKVSLTFALGLTIAACGGSGGGSSPDSDSGNLSGSVLNSPNPVSGVELTIAGPGGTFTTTTSNSGTYRVENVPPGAYSVSFSGEGVFDSAGNPIPDKIDLFLPSVTVISGENTLLNKPVFLPEKAISTDVATGGTAIGTIPAGTVITNPSAGATLIFEAETTVTFQDAQDTAISINRVAIDQTPVPLPAGFSGSSLLAIEPAGATFDVRPRLILANDLGLPGGTEAVALLRLDFATGTWLQTGTGTVTASGEAILTDAGLGLEATGWHGSVLTSNCTTQVIGRVANDAGTGLADILVSTINGASATTNAMGEFVINDVPLPSATFQVIVTAAPGANSGFLPAATNGTLGSCANTTNIGTLVLEEVLVDAIAPTVLSSSPANGATAVDNAASISVTFSEILSPGSVTFNTLNLTADGAPVLGTTGFEEVGGQTTVTFVPAAPLAVDTDYTLRVGAGVMDAAGNTLGADTAIAFRTAGSGSGGAPSVDVVPNAPAGINPGTTLQFSANVLDGSQTPVEGAQVAWSTDDLSVAVVDATGLLTALTPGSVIVSATFGSQIDEVQLDIVAPTVSSVSLAVDGEILAAGSVITIEAQALDASLVPLEGFSFNWTSDTPSVATVDAAGNVTAVGAGSPVVITATEPISGQFALVALSVIDPATIEAIEVDAGPGVLETGGSQLFVAQAIDFSQGPIPGVSFTWSSSDTSVATVDATGLVTGVGNGTASITATANNSGGINDQAEVTVYDETPLVVTVHGGPRGQSPMFGVTVIRHDAATGAFVEELQVDSDGRADFGPISASRTTLTVILPTDSPVGFQSELITLNDVPVGTVPLVLPPAFAFDAFGLEADDPTGLSDSAFVYSGGISGGDTYQSETREGLSYFFDFILNIETYLDGSSSFIVTTNDAATGAMRTAGFLLDLEFSKNGLGTFVSTSASHVGSTSFTSDTAVSPAGGTARRRNHLYTINGTAPQAALSGNTDMPMMPGADRFSLSFYGQPGPSNTRLFTEYVYATLPETQEVELPLLAVGEPTYDPETGSLQSSLSGPSAADMDLGEAELRYFSKTGPVAWKVQFNPNLASFTLPQLGEQLSDLTPISPEVSMSLRYIGLDIVNGYDALMQGTRQYRGSVENLKMDAAGSATGAEFATGMLFISIDNGKGNVVTIDTGDGPFEVTDEDDQIIPIGTSVTVTATPGLGFFVEGFDTPNCISMGQPTPETCTFVMQEQAQVDIFFEGNF